MNRVDTRLPDPELEHLPFELRVLAERWREPMSEQERTRALEELERAARDTCNHGMLWAVETLRRSNH